MSKKFDVIVADCPWSFSDKLRMSDIKRGAQANYSTMTISDIQQLPIKDICNPIGAVLCLWVPSSLLQEGLDTMKAWGFKHKQTYIWVKTKKNPYEDEYKSLKKRGILMIKYLLEHQFTPKDLKSEIESVAMTIAGKLGFLDFSDILAFGMGRLFRQTHEICLVGTSSNAVYKQLQNKSRRSVCFAENLKHSAKPEALQDSLEIMFPDSKKIELFARRIRPGWTCLGNEIDGLDIRDALDQLK
jgi:N6-adenosine-specific RNA methylase IME4